MTDSKPLELLMATTNHKKLEELRTLFADLPVSVRFLADLPLFEEVEETGKTFEENARLKAAGYARQSGLLTLAEDSGLCCDALEGAPGVYSARFAGEGRSDEENNQKLLRLLDKLPDNCRGAYYVSTIALADPDKVLTVVRGEVHGVIVREPRGSGGFGYDPIFFYPAFGKTFGEVPAGAKHEVSHRARAYSKLKEFLSGFLANRIMSEKD